VVTRKNVSKWSEAEVPSDEQLNAPGGGGRTINATGPLYTEEDVRTVLKKGSSAIILFTKKCRLDVASRLWDENDVFELLEFALAHGKRAKSEWCHQSPEGPVAACDVLIVRRSEKHPSKDTSILMEYYVKYAISATGAALLVISCHPTVK